MFKYPNYHKLTKSQKSLKVQFISKKILHGLSEIAQVNFKAKTLNMS